MATWLSERIAPKDVPALVVALQAYANGDPTHEAFEPLGHERITGWIRDTEDDLLRLIAHATFPDSLAPAPPTTAEALQALRKVHGDLQRVIDALEQLQNTEVGAEAAMGATPPERERGG